MLTRESSVFSSWESPEENGGNLIRSYDIRQYPTDNPAAVTSHHQWARDLLEGRTTNNRWSGNLTAHEEYTVEVWASNRIGNGPLDRGHADPAPGTGATILNHADRGGRRPEGGLEQTASPVPHFWPRLAGGRW